MALLGLCSCTTKVLCEPSVYFSTGVILLVLFLSINQLCEISDTQWGHLGTS